MVNQYCQTIRTDEINMCIDAFLLSVPTYLHKRAKLNIDARKCAWLNWP